MDEESAATAPAVPAYGTPAPHPGKLVDRLAVFGSLAAAALLILYVILGGIRVEAADDNPCASSLAANCLQPAPEAEVVFADASACEQPSKIVCLVPIGATSVSRLQNLKSNLETSGVQVAIAPPIALQLSSFDLTRLQFNADLVQEEMEKRYLGTLHTQGSLLVGILPEDLYLPSIDRWRYGFGQRSSYPNGIHSALISTARMYDVTENSQVKARIYRSGWKLTLAFSNEDEAQKRTQKLLNKYVGIVYFNLPLSGDPRSPMYNHILSVDDLDKMSAQLLELDSP